jgi:hypothetical protein
MAESHPPYGMCAASPTRHVTDWSKLVAEEMGDSDKSLQTPVPGMSVLIKDLKNASFYNGMMAKVVEFYPSENRVQISLEGGRRLKVKLENLDLVPEAISTHQSKDNTQPENSENGDEREPFSCAVCYEEFPEHDRAVLPCCGTRESTVQYCRRCIEIIIERGIEGNLGRCPTCSTFLTVKDGHFRVFDQAAGRCRRCLQPKVNITSS